MSIGGRLDGWRRPTDRMADARRRSKPRPALISGRHDTRSSGFHAARNRPARLATAVARGHRATRANCCRLLGLDAPGRARVATRPRRNSRCGCRAASSRACAMAIRTTRCCARCCRWTTKTAIVPGFELDAVGDARRARRQRRAAANTAAARCWSPPAAARSIAATASAGTSPTREETAAADGWRDAVDADRGRCRRSTK